MNTYWQPVARWAGIIAFGLLIVFLPLLVVVFIFRQAPLNDSLLWLQQLDYAGLQQAYPHTWWWFALAGMVSICINYVWAAIGVLFALYTLSFLYARSRQKKRFLKASALVLIGGMVSLFLYRFELLLRTKISTGFLTDELRQVDSVVCYNWTWCDSLGINRITPNTSMGINRDGFVSSFEYDTATLNGFRQQGKKVVMVVGDSFVEGAAPGGPDSTIVSHLQRMLPQCAVYNFGVGGSDPLNYELILKQYAPIIKPNLVLILFSNNDFMLQQRHPTPGVPIHFQANFMAGPGKYIDSRFWVTIADSCASFQFNRPDSLYQFLLSQYGYKSLQNPIFSFAMKSSAIATLAIRGFNKQVGYSGSRCNKDSLFFAYSHLMACKQATLKAGARWQIVYIPRISDNYKTSKDYGKVPDKIFRDLKTDVYLPTGYTKSDYISEENAHFNDAGNRKFALLCKQLIAEKLFQGAE